jgi:hypothetical protein
MNLRLCQAIESLKEDGPFSKSFLSNVVSAVSSAATIGNIANLINQYGSPSIDSPQNNNSNKSTISQVLSTLSTMGNSNGYNPLISIIDYISSFQNSPLADKYPSRRRKPLEPEDLLPVSPESPQTPCPAIDEYVSPTYARNYQGVWKYVVQIPSEGYSLDISLFFNSIQFYFLDISPKLFKEQVVCKLFIVKFEANYA